jgi:predicted DNA-binding protein
MTTFTLDANLEQQINFIAESEHTTVSTWIADKLARIVEDYQDVQAANAAIEEIERGESEFLSLDDAMRVIHDLDG